MYKLRSHSCLQWFVGMLFLTNISFNMYSRQNPKHEVSIIITERGGKVLFKESYWGRSAQEQEIFKKKEGSKLLEARINFEAIKRKLLEQSGGNLPK